MNPGGTGKDRAVKFMLRDAISKYVSNMTLNNEISSRRILHVFEGSSGSTGIALAHQCRAWSSAGLTQMTSIHVVFVAIVVTSQSSLFLTRMY